MTGSVALDVVIGLVFVYTLYSLLTTTITEFIATWIRLRPQFLIIGIRRMLDDGSGTRVFSKIFLGQPLIKYLTNGLVWFHRAPAYMSASNFSKNLLETLKIAYPLKAIGNTIKIMEEKVIPTVPERKAMAWEYRVDKLKAALDKKQVDPDDIIEFMQHVPTLQAGFLIHFNSISADLNGALAYLQQKPIEKISEVLASPKHILGRSETIKHIRSLFEDSQGDLEKFSAYLEQWYNDTMERVTGWYKKWIQVVTFFVGLGVAIFFNADTVLIVNILTKDPDARQQMVQMATAYIESHPAPPASDTSPTANASREKLDSLLNVTKDIRKDVESAHSVLGIGWDFPDTVKLITSAERDKKISDSKGNLLKKDFFEATVPGGELRYIQLDKLVTDQTIKRILRVSTVKSGHRIAPADETNTYALSSKYHFFWSGFWGYFLTAVALSLGAPFWFDLLNKLVKLRSSMQASTQESTLASTGATATSVPVTKRVG